MTPFISQGTTGAWSERLTWRYENLIAPYASDIAGRTVLDLGCHDGRWMQAALELGAAHVIGVEARTENLDRCRRNLHSAGITETSYTIRQANLEDPAALEDLTYDFVVAFGILYHVLSPLDLLRRICSKRPAMMLIDTAITRMQGRVLALHAEDPAIAGNGIVSHEVAAALVCHPSEEALIFVLDNFGYTSTIRRWNNQPAALTNELREPVIPTASQPLIDYQSGSRILIVARGVRPAI